MLKKIKILCIISFLVAQHLFSSIPIELATLPKEAGKLYLSITSPVEWYTRPHVIEEQHISPQSLAKKHNLKNDSTVLITWSNHTISDRWKDKPFLEHYDNDLLKILSCGSADRLEKLNIAYRLGANVYPYALFTYEYRKDTAFLLCLELDAPSMLVYGITWLIHIPYKLWQKIRYITDKDTAISIWCLLDVACNVLMLLIEIPLAVFCTLLSFNLLFFVWNLQESFCQRV